MSQNYPTSDSSPPYQLREGSDRFLANILTHSREAIFTLDMQGRFVTWNDGAANLFGYPAREIIQQPLDLLLCNSDDIELGSLFDTTGSESECVRRELCCRRSDGESVEIELSFASVLDPDDRRAGIAVFARDITERKQTERRLTAQYAVTAILADTDDLIGAAPKILRAIGESIGWDVVLLWSVDRSDRSVQCLNVWRGADRHLESNREIPIPGPLTLGQGPPGRVSSSGLAEWLVDVEKDESMASREREVVGGMRSGCAFPIMLAGDVFGAIECFSRERHLPDHELLEMLATVGSQIGQFIERKRAEEDRSRLLTLERSARTEAEAARQRFAFLAESSEILSSSLDYSLTLAAIARQAVPHLADWCAVDMKSNDGVVERLAVAHIDPAKVEWARRIQARYPDDPNSASGVPAVIREGRPEFYPYIPREMLTAAARDDEHRRMILEVGFTSAMIVPILVHGHEPAGAITFVSAESGRRYTEADLEMAQELARRAAIAIDNSRLYSTVREQRSRLTNIITSVPGIVWEAWGPPDLDHQRIDFVSDYVESLLGYQVDEWLNTPGFWLRIVHPDDREQAIADAAAIFESATGGVLQYRWVASDGHEVWAESHTVVVCDEDHNPIGMRGVAMDITARKRIEQKLRMETATLEKAESEMKKAKEEAEAANQAKDQFLAVLSHELRTPLTPVLAMTHLLETDPSLQEAHRPIVEMIRRNVELEAHLIDDMLDLTRITRGEMSLHLETVDSHVLIGNVLQMCSTEINGQRLQLDVHLDADRNYIRADATRIQQVIWNLIKNAIKFTPESGKIGITTRNGASGDLVIEVSDNGIGIEPEILPYIFNAFEQGEQYVTRHFGGLGLGLAISRALMQMHGGTLTARSDGRDHGATFQIELPSVDKAASKRHPAPTGDDPESAGKDPVHVLIVDDHVETVKVMKMLLERRGFVVQSAHSAGSALQLAATSGPFDILIVDLGLPDGNGTEIMRRLTDIQAIPGIALSGSCMDEDIRRSQDAGFSEHLVKPVSFQSLQEAIWRVLG